MSEQSAIEAFNSNTAAKLLRDKVRIAFVELIPASEWESMIKAEFQLFFERTDDKDSYGRSRGTRSSDFTVLCRETIQEILKEQLKTPELRGDLAKIVREQLDARAPELLREIVMKGLANLTKMVPEQIQYQIQDALNNALMNR